MPYESIAIIGDSQAEGLATPLAHELARRNVGTVTGTATVSGASTRVLLDRRKPAALMEHTDADLVIVALGGNDTATSSYGRTLEEFVSALKRPDGSSPEIVWIGPAYSERADVDARHAMVSAAQAQVLPALGVRWYDSREWTGSGHAGDEVHFTREAYIQQAQEIVGRVLSSGAGPWIAAGVAAVVTVLGAVLWWNRPRRRRLRG